MNRHLLNFKPVAYLCPFCGMKHSLNEYLKKDETLKDLSGIPIFCNQMWGDKSKFNIYFEKNGIIILAKDNACRNLGFNISLAKMFYPYEDVKIDHDEKCITIMLQSDELESHSIAEIDEHCRLSCTTDCYLYRHMNLENGVITVPLKIFFSDVEWEKIFLKNYEEKGQEDQTDGTLTDTDETTDTMCEQQEEDNMTQQESQGKQVKKETVLTRLYEYPPKENVELLKKTVEEHKPAVRFLIFATSIYLAYKILNKRDCKFNANNIDEFCKKNLGLELDFLKNKARVDDIISIGKGLLVLYGLKQFDKHFLVDNIKNGSLEDGIQRIEEASKKSSSFAKKFEELFPVAISIIFMYVMTRNPDWFEKAKQKLITTGGDLYNKAQVYLEMAKLFIADKFDIDLDDKEECQNAIKFAVMALILLVIAFVYGKKFIKKVWGKDGEKETSISKFAKQIMKSMEKLMPKAFKKSRKWLEEHSKDEELPVALVDDDEGDTPF